MKKILTFIVTMMLAVPSFGQLASGGFELDKNNVYYGARFGATVASISGDFSVGSKVGLTLAGVIGLRLSETNPIFLESGVYYTQRGGKNDDYNITHNNFEIPLIIKYGIKATDKIALLPFIGPYFAYAISADEDLKSDYAKQHDVRVNRNNMGIKLGCGAEYDKIYLEVGYQFGLTSILDDSFSAEWEGKSARNNALFMNLGVNF